MFVSRFLSVLDIFMQDTQDSKMPRMFLAAVILISMCGPLGMNIILPSLSSYQDVFKTDYANAQLTLTFYLSAIALATYLRTYFR